MHINVVVCLHRGAVIVSPGKQGAILKVNTVIGGSGILWGKQVCRRRSGRQELPGEPGGEGDALVDIARWRCGLLIENMTAHYNNLFCVSFYCCFDQEPSTHL